MVTISLNVDPPITVDTLALDNGEQFFVVYFDGGLCSIILPGRDEEAIWHARALAMALITAAEALAAVRYQARQLPLDAPAAEETAS